jgi:hypothetical protein
MSSSAKSNRLKTEHNSRAYARVALRGVEELGLQVVRLHAPSYSADQAEVDTSSEIKRKRTVSLADTGDKCVGRNALVSQSEKGLSKRRQPADRGGGARAE